MPTDLESFSESVSFYQFHVRNQQIHTEAPENIGSSPFESIKTLKNYSFFIKYNLTMKEPKIW